MAAVPEEATTSAIFLSPLSLASNKLIKQVLPVPPGVLMKIRLRWCCVHQL